MAYDANFGFDNPTLYIYKKIDKIERYRDLVEGRA